MVSCYRVVSKTAQQKSAKLIFLVLFEKKCLELFPLKKEMGLSECKTFIFFKEYKQPNNVNLFWGSRGKRREVLITWNDWIFILMP